MMAGNMIQTKLRIINRHKLIRHKAGCENRFMNRLLYKIGISAFVVTAVICILIAYRYAYYPIIAQGLTRNKIQSIVPDMKCEKAKLILGVPIGANIFHTIDNKGKIDEHTVYIYAAQGLFTEPFEVYLRCENNFSIAMSVEHYDYGVYYCDKDRCPRIMRPDLYEKLGEFLNEKP